MDAGTILDRLNRWLNDRPQVHDIVKGCVHTGKIDTVYAMYKVIPDDDCEVVDHHWMWLCRDCEIMFKNKMMPKLVECYWDGFMARLKETVQ